MCSDELRDRARRVLPGGNTRHTVFVPPHPPYAVRGEGCIILDASGRKIVDGNNNYTALIHGHAHPDLVAGATSAIADGAAFGLPTRSEVEFAELLHERVGLPEWRFCNSGTEAVMMAVRGARAFTGRDVIVRFDGSYHGTGDAVVSHAAPGIPAGVRSEILELPQGDVVAFDRAMAEHGPDVAAVLIDLMPNRAGLVPADPEFVEHVRQVSTSVGALLIVDEVITLRLGMAGLSGVYGVDPDLLVAGKIIGGGFPVGAVGGRRDVLAVFDPQEGRVVSWGGTFSANPVTMTTGRLATELFDAEAIDLLNERGDDLRGALLSAGVAVSGSGSLVRLREQVPPDKLFWAAYERGLLIGTNGLVSLSTAMGVEDLEAVERICVLAVRSLRGS